MKKFVTFIIAFVALASVATAQVRDVDFGTYSLVTTNSDSKAYTVYGLVESVYIDNAASKTSVVLVTSSQGTVFSLTSTADGLYYPRVLTHNTSGAVLTNAQATADYAKIALSGLLTVRVAGAADTTGTNSTAVSITVSQK